MRIIKVYCLLVLFPLLWGCATIVSKDTQLIALNSNPAQANLVITDEYNKAILSSQTPTTVVLKKGDGYFHGKDYSVKFSKDGYSSQSFVIKSQPNGWYILGNFLFGGLVGWFIVDPLTGAMWTLAPDELDAILEKNPTNQKIKAKKTSMQDGAFMSFALLQDVQ